MQQFYVHYENLSIQIRENDKGKECVLKSITHKVRTIYTIKKDIFLFIYFYVPRGTDIHTILLCVNNDVSSLGEMSKQMPVHEVAMRKKLILRPVNH